MNAGEAAFAHCCGGGTGWWWPRVPMTASPPGLIRNRLDLRAVYMTGAGTAASLGYPDFGLVTMSEMVGQNAGRIAGRKSMCPGSVADCRHRLRPNEAQRLSDCA